MFGYRILGFGGKAAAAAGAANYGNRGLIPGGARYIGSLLVTDTIDYIAIDTAGNAADFGDCSATSWYSAACQGGGRGIVQWGGYTQPPYGGGLTEIIEYVTIGTLGDATDFGDTGSPQAVLAAVSDGSRGCSAGGAISGDDYIDVIEYITIASTGDASDFGEMTTGRSGVGAAADATRGVFHAGGGPPGGPYYNPTIDYITIQTTGDATEFGDATVGAFYGDGLADDTRGVFGGGEAPFAINIMDYVTIQTTGNATDFGDLPYVAVKFSAMSNGTRGIFSGGRGSSINYDTISYITVQTTGNTSDFGETILPRYGAPGVSGD